MSKCAIVQVRRDMSVAEFRNSQYAKNLAKEWGVKTEDLVVSKIRSGKSGILGFEVTT